MGIKSDAQKNALILNMLNQQQLYQVLSSFDKIQQEINTRKFIVKPNDVKIEVKSGQIYLVDKKSKKFIELSNDDHKELTRFLKKYQSRLPKEEQQIISAKNPEEEKHHVFAKQLQTHLKTNREMLGFLTNSAALGTEVNVAYNKGNYQLSDGKQTLIVAPKDMKTTVQNYQHRLAVLANQAKAALQGLPPKALDVIFGLKDDKKGKIQAIKNVAYDAKNSRFVFNYVSSTGKEKQFALKSIKELEQVIKNAAKTNQEPPRPTRPPPSNVTAADFPSVPQDMQPRKEQPYPNAPKPEQPYPNAAAFAANSAAPVVGGYKPTPSPQGTAQPPLLKVPHDLTNTDISFVLEVDKRVKLINPNDLKEMFEHLNQPLEQSQVYQWPPETSVQHAVSSYFKRDSNDKLDKFCIDFGMIDNHGKAVSRKIEFDLKNPAELTRFVNFVNMKNGLISFSNIQDQPNRVPAVAPLQNALSERLSTLGAKTPYSAIPSPDDIKKDNKNRF